ncbi:DMT family transporter [Streptomyces sp. 1331.2]|uniref:DMT family transporter n=1 Tax=Streptomyces sp. 1331.2 TaxID=1938835 RepID=UPI000BD32916|nr:DMT family transporter [Streptomyces sp. 1331.2]SOB83530.1 Permease of the drug/metabolite transporter (DMT) superfamily [Streptomyces sp. 1331.2]
MTEQDSAIRPAAVAPQQDRTSGTALAALGVASFSLSFPATAWSLTGFGPWSSTGLRGVLAAVLAGLYLLASDAPLPTRRQWPGLLVVSAGCVLGFPLLTTLALRTSSTAHSAVVIGVLPLATAVVSAVRTGRRPSRAFWAAALAGASAVLVFTLLQSHGRPTVADLYLFVGLVVCAAGYAEGGRLSRDLPGAQVIAWAVLAALPVMALTSAFGLSTEPVRFGAKAVAGLLYIAGVSQFGGFVLWYRGMAGIGVPRASQLQLAQPLLTLVWSVLLLGEDLPAAAPVTAVVVLVCIAVTQRART